MSKVIFAALFSLISIDANAGSCACMLTCPAGTTCQPAGGKAGCTSGSFCQPGGNPAPWENTVAPRKPNGEVNNNAVRAVTRSAASVSE